MCWKQTSLFLHVKSTFEFLFTIFNVHEIKKKKKNNNEYFLSWNKFEISFLQKSDQVKVQVVE